MRLRNSITASFAWSCLVSHSTGYLAVSQAANVTMVVHLKTMDTDPFTNRKFLWFEFWDCAFTSELEQLLRYSLVPCLLLSPFPLNYPLHHEQMKTEMFCLLFLHMDIWLSLYRKLFVQKAVFPSMCWKNRLSVLTFIQAWISDITPGANHDPGVMVHMSNLWKNNQPVKQNFCFGKFIVPQLVYWLI